MDEKLEPIIQGIAPLSSVDQETLNPVKVDTRISFKYTITGEEITYTVKSIPSKTDPAYHLLENLGSTKYITPIGLARHIQNGTATILL